MTLKAPHNESLSAGTLRLYAFNDDDVPVGCVELYAYDPLNRRAAVGIVIAKEYRKQGYGKDALKALAAFCVNNTSLHQIYADISADNEVSLHLFLKAGYRQCGTLRQWVLRNNCYLDTYRLQYILA